MILELLALATLLATLASLPRVALGPSAADRIAGTLLAGTGTGTVATLILLGATAERPAFHEIALVTAALGAIAGLAFAALGRPGA